LASLAEIVILSISTGPASTSSEKFTEGAVVSMIKLEILSCVEIFPAASVTVIVQFECVQAESALNVMVLFPLVAVVVALLQSPP
jgi:hypothetical protein